MEDKKYRSRGSRLVDLALKQTTKLEDEENGKIKIKPHKHFGKMIFNSTISPMEMR